MHRLVSPELLQLLMQRTGTGVGLSIRKLADAVGIPHTTIGNLLSGEQKSVAGETAHAIAAVIGVDVLVLWIPIERAGAMQLVPTETDEAAA